MTPILWIAFGFTAALVGFLMLTFFVKDTSSPTQYNTLHFLTSLCAGFAGGFFTGEALFRFDQTLAAGGKIAVSGTAGCALFFVLWFTYPKREPPPPPQAPLKDRMKISVGAGWTFEQATDAIIRAARATVRYEGFTADQMALKLPAIDIDTETPRDALDQLRYYSNELPKYEVELRNGVYYIRARNS
jgi:hypothetical protein